MGQNDRQESTKRARNKAQRQARRANTAGNWEFDAATIVELSALAVVVAQRGRAVRIGLTRDGGALALGMYVDDDYATEYIRPNEDIGEATAEIVGAWIPDGADDFLKWREYLYEALGRARDVKKAK